MARDCSVELRRALVARLKADAGVAAIVDDRVYGLKAETDPVWPFVRIDALPSFPDPDGCSEEPTRYRFNIHAFAKGDDEAGCQILSNKVGAVVDGLGMQIAAAPEAWLRDTLWTGTQVLGDIVEKNGWHGVIGFEAFVSADAE